MLFAICRHGDWQLILCIPLLFCFCGAFSSKVKNTWTEDQEEELLRLFEMFGDNENPGLKLI